MRDADPAFVRERFNVVMQRMVLELRGVPCLELEDHVPDRKSIIASRSFGRPNFCGSFNLYKRTLRRAGWAVTGRTRKAREPERSDTRADAGPPLRV